MLRWSAGPVAAVLLLGGGVYVARAHAAGAAYERVSAPEMPFHAPQDLAVSDDGRYVAFAAAEGSDGDPRAEVVRQVYLADRVTRRMRIISRGPDGAVGNATSEQVSMSANGRWIVFASPATNLVRGDTNGLPDAFLYDARAGKTTRISVDRHGRELTRLTASDIALCQHPVISANGSTIAFLSHGNVLADPAFPGTRANTLLLYAVSRVRGPSSVVAVMRTPSGDYFERTPQLDPYERPAVSGDGRYVAWTTSAGGNLTLSSGEEPLQSNVYLRDLVSRRTMLVSSPLPGDYALESGIPTAHTYRRQVSVAMDRAGRYVAYDEHSSTPFAVFAYAPQEKTVRIRDTKTGRLTMLAGPSPTRIGTTAYYTAHHPQFSPDGRYLSYMHASQDIGAPEPVAFKGGAETLVVWDRLRNTFRDVAARCDPLPAQACGDAFRSHDYEDWDPYQSFTVDGGRLAFVTWDAFTSDDPDSPAPRLNPADVYLARLDG